MGCELEADLLTSGYLEARESESSDVFGVFEDTLHRTPVGRVS